MTAHLKATRLSVGTILAVVFVLVSSGPFGVEEMVSATGPGMALLLILAIPFVWGAPLALVCTELASAIPAMATIRGECIALALRQGSRVDDTGRANRPSISGP